MHLWASQASSRLLRIRISYYWYCQLILQRVSFPLYNTHPTWLSLTHELKFDDCRYQINSLMFVNLLLLIINFSFICEEQPCRVRITYMYTYPRISSRPPVLTGCRQQARRCLYNLLVVAIVFFLISMMLLWISDSELSVIWLISFTMSDIWAFDMN